MALEYLAHLARLNAGDIHPGGAAASAAVLAALQAEPGQRILELGCGTGATLARVCRNEAVKVFGLDLLPEMLVQARRRLRAAGIAERAVLVRGSAVRMPFLAAKFDAAYSESVLGFQKTGPLRAMLNELHRVLRPGGRLIVSDAIWKPDVTDELAQALNAACERDFGLPQASESAWTVRDWLEAFETAGFEVLSCERLKDATASISSAAMQSSDTSGLVERLRRGAVWLTPSIIAGCLRYRCLLARYQPMSNHVEGRLFVLARPA